MGPRTRRDVLRLAIGGASAAALVGAGGRASAWPLIQRRRGTRTPAADLRGRRAEGRLDGGHRPRRRGRRGVPALVARDATLDDARRDFPSARSLDDELDGVAVQKAVDSGTGRVFYPPGRFVHNTAVVVRSGQRHVGAGRFTTLQNVRRRTTPYDDARAHSFQIGNVHPVAMNLADPVQAWAVRCPSVRLPPAPRR